MVKKVADLVTKNKKLQNSNKNSFEQSYKLKKFIEESGNEVISDLKVQSKFIENARFMDNNRFCKNERMNTENSLVMTPLYNDIRKNKYKSKIGITQYMAGTPNIESFSKRARIFSATNNGNKENWRTLRKCQKKLFGPYKENHKQNLSQGDLLKFKAVDSVKEDNDYETDEEIEERDSGEYLEKVADRKALNRPSLSSFWQNDISEKCEMNNTAFDLNKSLRRKSPVWHKPFLSSFKKKKFLVKEHQKSEKTNDSEEIKGFNENLGVINPQGYAFNTWLPQKGLSKYNGNC